MRPVADQQILIGAAATLSYQFRDADGEPAAPTGTATIGIDKADGTEVVAAGTATGGATNAPRTYSLAAQSELGLLTATWTDDNGGRTQLVEIVGGYYFDVATVRARETALADETDYPNTVILRARREVEQQCELICGVSWVPRFRRTTVVGSGRQQQPLPDAALRGVRSVTVDGTTWSQDQVASVVVGDGADPTAGVATRSDGAVWPEGAHIVIEYEHGYDRPPADLALAAILHLRHQINATETGVSDRATQLQSVDGGTILLATPGRFGFETGIPAVDAVYQRYSHREIGGIA